MRRILIPMKNIRSATLAALLGWLTVVSAASAQSRPADAPAAPSIETFFRRAQFGKARLSPSGRYLGLVMGNDKERARLAVLDLDDGMRVSIAAVFNDADVRSFEWLNDERLVFDATDRHTDDADRRRPPGLWAVNRDGSEFRQLIESAYWSRDGFAPLPKTKRILPGNWEMHSALDDGSADILVEEFRGSVGGELIATSVRRMNTLTGELRSVLGGGGLFGQSVDEPAGTLEWWFDAQGRPAVVRTLRGLRAAVHKRDAKTGAWQQISEFDAYTGQGIAPNTIDVKGVLYVLVPGAKGRLALHRWDEAAAKPEATSLIGFDGFDFDGDVVLDRAKGGVLGAHVLTEADTTIWLDAAMRELQRSVDARLPDTHNRLSCTDCSRRVLVASSSDRQPVFYHLVERATGTLKPLVESRPWIAPAAMSHAGFVRYKARDGREIPAYVTLPGRAAKAADGTLRPAVVLVHGGPYLRGGDGGWEPQAQFLASRGYVVIEPEFRGSTGFGFDHFRAGWKQWGLAMQDDLDDALAWAVANAGVDPKRACIAGASYGGYAALMGLVRDDSPYRCAVEWVGISDISLIFDLAGTKAGNRWYRYGLRALVGDPDRDAAQLRATSPLAQAAKIRKPLLMAYGGADLTVPVKHGNELRAALPKENRDVEWVLYPDEGHGWFQLATHVDFWGRVEKFLDRHIGDAAAPK